MGNHEAVGAFSEHKNSSCSSSINLSNESPKLAVSLLVLSGTQYRDLQLQHCAEGETSLCAGHQRTSGNMATGYARRGTGALAQSALKAINRGTSIVVLRRLIQSGMVLGIQENLKEFVKARTPDLRIFAARSIQTGTWRNLCILIWKKCGGHADGIF